MPKLRKRRKKNDKYGSLTAGDNGLKVTKGISEALKKAKLCARSDVNPDRRSDGSENGEKCPLPPPPPRTQEEKEEILRQFDLDWRFGPSIGITRLQRWARAEKLGQHPPKQVEEMLRGEHPDSQMHHCLWSVYKLI